MKKIILLSVLAGFLVSDVPVYAEDYDPLHTMLALNMAIVSVHRIITTKDRIVLDQEYNNIINNLSLGNIESDYEMTGLYDELLSFIKSRQLRQDEAKRFRQRYESREQRQFLNSMANIRAYGGNIWSWLGSLAVSCVSSYFDYQGAKAELLEGLEDELWQLKKDDIEDCNELQTRLLNSSWNLLRQYKLPDNYRLVQKNMDEFYKAVNEKDSAKRLRMLRALEKDFSMYPPYWFYRGQAAHMTGDNSETQKCFERFDKVWRPVLRQDPYIVETAKYRITELTRGQKSLSGKARTEVLNALELMRNNIPRENWADNLFAGTSYFMLGEKKKGIECIQENVDFGYGSEISSVILKLLEAGKLDLANLNGAVDSMEAQILIASTEDKETARALSEYFKGNDSEARKMFEALAVKSKNPVVFRVLWLMERVTTPSASIDEKLGKLSQKHSELQKSEFYDDIAALTEFYAEKGSENALIFIIACGKDSKGEYYLRLSGNKDYQKKNYYFLTEHWAGWRYYHDDKSKSLEHFRNSARKGYANGADLMGYVYYNKEDYKNAYIWFKVAELMGLELDNDSQSKIKVMTEGKKGWIWDDKPLLSKEEVKQCEEDARKEYNELNSSEEKPWWILW